MKKTLAVLLSVCATLVFILAGCNAAPPNSATDDSMVDTAATITTQAAAATQAATSDDSTTTTIATVPSTTTASKPVANTTRPTTTTAKSTATMPTILDETTQAAFSAMSQPVETVFAQYSSTNPSLSIRVQGTSVVFSFEYEYGWEIDVGLAQTMLSAGDRASAALLSNVQTMLPACTSVIIQIYWVDMVAGSKEYK